MNYVILSGNTTRVLELYKTEGKELEYTYITLAVRKDYNRNAKNKNAADFVRCKAWGRMAMSMVENVNKGQFITIVGKLNTYRVEDEKNKPRTEMVVTVVSYEFYERKDKKTDDIGFIDDNNGNRLPYEDEASVGAPYDL